MEKMLSTSQCLQVQDMAVGLSWDAYQWEITARVLVDRRNTLPHTGKFRCNLEEEKPDVL